MHKVSAAESIFTDKSVIGIIFVLRLLCIP